MPSWVMTTDENGTQRQMPLIWDITQEGTFTMGVPNSHLGELERALCKNPGGSPLYSSFDMYGWINETVNVNGQQVIPKEVTCEWKNKPDHVDVNDLTADIQSPDYIYRMHEEFEIIHYRIEYTLPNNSSNLTLNPIWSINQSSYISNPRAILVNNLVDENESVWFWWSQNYSMPFNLSDASINDQSQSGNNDGDNGVNPAVFIIGGVILCLLLIHRRKKKKIKKAMKKIAKQQIKEEKAAKKMAKQESKRKIKDIDKMELKDPITTNTKPNPKPSKDLKGAIGDDGYEWITFPPNSQKNFYRAPGETEWKYWEE